MRERFYRTARLLLCLVFLISSVPGFAEEEAPMFEKYGYRSSYRYNDEMIANALKATVPQIRMVYSAIISHEPVTFNEAYAVEMFHNIREKADETVTAGDIAAAVLDDIRQNTKKYMSLGGRKEKIVEGVFTGSGVVIGEDGYIATSSNVAASDENLKKEMYYCGLREEVDRNVSKLTEGFEKYGVSFSDKEVDSFCELILDFAVEHLQLAEVDAKLEVWFPASHGETRADAAKVYEAEVVAGGVQNIAILKIDAENLVALNLSELYPELNSKIVSAGFSDAADSSVQGSDEEKTGLNLIQRNGAVVRPVSTEGAGFQVIGITSTLPKESSGGPSVDANLDVEGLNTYINLQDNRLGYLIPARLVKNLSSGLEIGQGEVSKMFMTGLQLLQDGYGPAAVECFRRVAEYQPETPYINSIIELAEAAPDNKYVVKTDKRVFMMIAVTGLSAALVVALVIILIIAEKRKKKNAVAASADGAVPLYPAGNGLEDETVKPMTPAAEGTVPLVSYRPPVPEDAPRPVIPSQHTEAADADLR